MVDLDGVGEGRRSGERGREEVLRARVQTRTAEAGAQLHFPGLSAEAARLLETTQTLALGRSFAQVVRLPKAIADTSPRRARRMPPTAAA